MKRVRAGGCGIQLVLWKHPCLLVLQLALERPCLLVLTSCLWQRPLLPVLAAVLMAAAGVSWRPREQTAAAAAGLAPALEDQRLASSVAYAGAARAGVMGVGEYSFDWL